MRVLRPLNLTKGPAFAYSRKLTSSSFTNPYRSLRTPRRSSNTLRHAPPVTCATAKTRQVSSDASQGHNEPTIYALSSAPGRGAIAIVRISGPACIEIYQSLCPDRPIPKPRHASIRTLYDPSPSGEEGVLDSEALVLFFPAPKTVTGEDILELHIHGGPAIVRAVLEAIPKCTSSTVLASGRSAIRYAEPGEFTRRAFYNNRLDLTQIEALGGTLAAETEQQRRLAVRGTRNPLASRYEEWRTQLLYARGELEALIDFSEDQHFDESPVELVSSITGQVKDLQRQIDLHIRNASKGELLRRGISIALLGAPNAGKSSLLNRIVGREAAIVSSEEGTTRDVVDVGVDIGGWFCRLGDMAGLRTKPKLSASGNAHIAIGEVEKEGMRRAKARALESDVVIVVLSIETDEPTKRQEAYLDEEVVDAVRRCLELNKAILVAVNKIDKIPSRQLDDAMAPLSTLTRNLPQSLVFPISCKEASNSFSIADDPGNVQAFLKGLTNVFENLALPLSSDGLKDISYWEDSLGVTHRQSLNLEQCKQHLHEFLLQTSPFSKDGQEKDSEVDIVASAEHLRAAADCLAKITGKGEAGDVEEVLGVVFEKLVSPTVILSTGLLNVREQVLRGQIVLIQTSLTTL